MAAGESENPRRDVPRSIRTVFWRIMFFYIGAIAVIGTLLPYTDPSLLSAAEESTEGCRTVALHACLRAHGHRRGGGRHERRHPDVDSVGR